MTQDSKIILLAHGRRGYAQFAFNMAMSIKDAGCNIPICLYVEKEILEGVPMQYFDEVIYIEPEFYTDKGQRSVALSKINIIRDLPAEHNLYLDVDGLCLKDLTPLMDALIKTGKPYLSDVQGKGKRGDEINYDCWVKHDYAWPFFNLTEDSEWPAIQSSWAYFRRHTAKEMHGLLMHFYQKGYPLTELKQRWAKNQLPDELLFSGVCASIGYDPSFDLKPVFFGTDNPKGSLTELLDQYYVLSMYGNGSHNSARTMTKLVYQDFYSKTVLNLSRKYHMPWYKKEYVMRDKIINF